MVVATGPFQIPRMPEHRRLPRSSRWSRCTAASTGGPAPSAKGHGPRRRRQATPAFRSQRSSPARIKVHLAIGSRQTAAAAEASSAVISSGTSRRTGLIRKSLDSRLGRRLSARDTLIGSSPRAHAPPRRRGSPARRLATDGSTVTFADGAKLDVDCRHLGDRLSQRLLVDRCVPVFDRARPPRASPRGHRHRRAFTSLA